MNCLIGNLLVVLNVYCQKLSKKKFVFPVFFSILFYRHRSLLNEGSKSPTRNPGMSLSKLMAGNSSNSVEFTLPGREYFCLGWFTLPGQEYFYSIGWFTLPGREYFCFRMGYSSWSGIFLFYRMVYSS